jgi:hypothetical protein
MRWSTTSRWAATRPAGWEQVRDYAAGLRGAAEVAALKRPVPEDAAGAAGQISDLTAVPLGLPEGEVVQRQLERGHADLAGNVAQPRCALVDEIGTTNGARSGSAPNSSSTCGPRASGADGWSHGCGFVSAIDETDPVVVAAWGADSSQRRNTVSDARGWWSSERRLDATHVASAHDHQRGSRSRRRPGRAGDAGDPGTNAAV